MSAGLDVARLREDFPILGTRVHGKPLVYLDNAATSQKPMAVLRRMDQYWQEENANVHRGVHALSQKATAEFDNAREKVRAFLNAKHTRECVFTSGCTESVNLVAQSFARPRLRPGDEILVSEMEHHSNIVPWQMAAEETGAKLKVIPIDDQGEILFDRYEAMLGERTRIVAVAHIGNALGAINPVREMIAKAHAAGAVFLVDGAQAGAHEPIDVQDLDADFYTLSCHKMYAPMGVGVLYGKEKWLEEMPPYQGGGDMISTVSFEKSAYAAIPAKFEAGTPNVAAVIGLGAALDYLQGIGREAARSHERELAEYAARQVAEIEGVKVWGPSVKTSLFSFTMDCAHPHDVGTILDSGGVAIRAGHHCCMPLMARLGVPATARASFAFYNTFEEADALAAQVRKVRELFA